MTPMRHRQPNHRITDTSAAITGEYGTHWTSRALRLNYDTLRRRLESRDRRRAPGAPVFVDLVPSSSDATPGGGVAEMIDAEGAVVHVEWTGSGPPDLAALAAAFYGPRS